MKYEIEIEDALVPEGVLPKRFAKPIDGNLVMGAYGQLVVTYPRKNNALPTLIFERVHVPKIPDFVPEGWFIYRNNISDRVFVTDEKPVNGNTSWYSSAPNAICIEVTNLNFDRDALFGDLPPEQCCFQQKKHEIDPEIYRDAT